MKILVAGQSGQLAMALAETGASQAHIDLVAMGREQMDITDMAAVERAINSVTPDLVINAAAYTAVDKAESDEAAAFAGNETGPRHLAEATAARDIPIVHVSTDYVFDGTKSGPYVEDDPVAPAGVYGASKLAGEQAVGSANPRHLIVRTAWIFSATGHNFVKTMLRLAADRDQLNVVDDQHGNPTYAPHLAEALLAVAPRLTGPNNGSLFGLYHLAGTGTTSWCGLAREVFAQSLAQGGASATVEGITTAQYPTPAKRPANSQLDCSKFEETFGVTMPPWQDGVAQAVSRLVNA